MEERRTHLLAVAERLIRQYGPQKTTIADIAKAAEVGVGSVYLEFPNKNALLLAISEERYRQILAKIEVAFSKPGPIEARLKGALSARLTGFLDCASEGIHAADLLHCGACGPIQRAHHAFRDAERALFARFLREGRDAGSLALKDPARAAHALLLAYEAFSPPQVFKRERKATLRALEDMHQLVLFGLLSRGSREEAVGD